MVDSYWTRLTERRLSRRAALRAGATSFASLGAASILAACGGKSNNKAAPTNAPGVASSVATAAPAGSGGTAAAGATPTLGQPGKTGGTVAFGFTGPFNGVDPHSSVYGGSGIVPVVYPLLIRTNIQAPEWGIIPDLAQSYEVLPDKLTYVFKLRPDMMIAQNSLGVPVRAMDADDVVANFQRVADAKLGLNGYSFMHDHVDKVEAVDKQTFRLVTKKPYAWTLNNVADNLAFPIAPKEWLASPDLKKNAVGAGYMMLQELVENSHATMVKNPNYVFKGRPYLDSLRINAYADQATFRTAFTSGQNDNYWPENADEAKQIQQTVKNSQYFKVPSLSFLSFWMNTKVKPWDDPRIRRAVSRAINRDEYIQLIGHGAGQQIGPVTFAMHPYDLPVDELKTKDQPFSIKDAKDLLAAAGQPNLTFEFTHSTSSVVPDYVNIFVRQMQAAGITAKAQPEDAGTWVAAYYASKLSASLSLNQDYKDPNTALLWFHTGGITGNGHYDTGFSDPEVDAAIEKAAQTLDDQQRVAAYQDAQRLIYSKDPPFLNFFGGYNYRTVQPYVMNYSASTVTQLGYWLEQFLWTSK